MCLVTNTGHAVKSVSKEDTFLCTCAWKEAESMCLLPVFVSDWMCVCVLVLHAPGGGLLLSAVIQYILYNNWQCVGGSRHLERCNPCCAWHYTLYVCVCVYACTFVCVWVSMCVFVCVFVSTLQLQIDNTSSTVVRFLGTCAWQIKER